MSNPLDKFISTKSGPFGSVRSCLICPQNKPFFIRIPAGQGGFAAGNKARGELIAHIKAAHPDEANDAIASRKGK
jgi:hypothetical protein